MRYLALKSFKLGERVVSYKEALRIQIERPASQQAGMNVAEMRTALKLLDKLDAATDVLVLEDAEWEVVKGKVESAGWVKADRGIMQFCDDVISAPTEKPAESDAAFTERVRATAAANGKEPAGKEKIK